MNKSISRPILAMAALCCSGAMNPASADVKLASLFQNHAVLQSGQPMPVWGRADAGEKVSVAFAGQNLSTTADDKGVWKVTLAPLPVNAAPQTMTVSGNNTLNIEDVVVGEVWLCSGQSNMEFKLSRAKDAEAEIAAANFPLIRQFHAAYAFNPEPQTTMGGDWVAASPATAKDFTAVGYFFAREVQQKLGVPIGLIHSSWGGTNIESWMSGASIAQNPDLAFVPLHWQQRLDDYPARKAKYDADLAAWQQKSDDAKAKGAPFTARKPSQPAQAGVPHLDMPSGLFNSMIAPVTPFAIRGVLWYQGENNAGRPAEYAPLMTSLIEGWRQAFGQPNLPFFWVQLPNYNGGKWVEMRVAQSKALALPATGQAITIDVGEAGNIHPINKQPVGERLARLALHRVYGQNIVDTGPRFVAAKFAGNSARVELSDIAGGLKFEGETLSGFEVAGADQKFVPASARIEGATVVVNAPTVPLPVAVRYAWHNAPVATLINSEGLPAAPFRSDNW